MFFMVVKKSLINSFICCSKWRIDDNGNRRVYHHICLIEGVKIPLWIYAYIVIVAVWSYDG